MRFDDAAYGRYTVGGAVSDEAVNGALVKLVSLLAVGEHFFRFVAELFAVDAVAYVVNLREMPVVRCDGYVEVLQELFVQRPCFPGVGTCHADYLLPGKERFPTAPA
jgi:hypothetical protein